MHSLEAVASPAGRFFAAKCRRRIADCRISDASQDIVGGRISPNIKVAKPNLVMQFTEIFSPLCIAKYY